MTFEHWRFNLGWWEFIREQKPQTAKRLKTKIALWGIMYNTELSVGVNFDFARTVYTLSFFSPFSVRHALQLMFKKTITQFPIIIRISVRLYSQFLGAARSGIFYRKHVTAPACAFASGLISGLKWHS